jgi:crossover junction endodeoxyribonuclease RuvC
MRVIGIDPGNAATGFAVVENVTGGFRHIVAGTIRAHRNASPSERLRNIYEHLLETVDAYAPAVMSLERNFSAVNIQSAFRLGEARAIAKLAAAQRGLELFEYTPTEVKLTVAGFGTADKTQVKSMVRRTFGIDTAIELSDDAADALAIAACHLFKARFIAPPVGCAGRQGVR